MARTQLRGDDYKMSEKLKPTHTQPGGLIGNDKKNDDGVTNDSLGTIDPADSTGVDDETETGDAKKNNKPTHED
jgi:hypothetical protein